MTKQEMRELADVAIGMIKGVITKYEDGTISLTTKIRHNSIAIATAEHSKGETIVQDETGKIIYKRTKYNQEEFRI